MVVSLSIKMFSFCMAHSIAVCMKYTFAVVLLLSPGFSYDNYLLTYYLPHLLTTFLTHLFTHSLTPCSTVLLEKLTGSQLVKKFPTFYGT